MFIHAKVLTGDEARRIASKSPNCQRCLQERLKAYIPLHGSEGASAFGESRNGLANSQANWLLLGEKKLLANTPARQSKCLYR
jgi:hypothetical protein